MLSFNVNLSRSFSKAAFCADVKMKDCGVSKLGEKHEADFTVGFQVSYENPKHDGAFHEKGS